MVLLGWMLFCLMLSTVRTETTAFPKQETTSETHKSTEPSKQPNINVNEIPKIYALVYNPYLQNRVVSPAPPNPQYNNPAKQFARQYVVLMSPNNQQPQPQTQQQPIQRPNQPLQAIFVNKNTTDQNIAASGHNANQLPPGQSYMRIFIPGHGLHNLPVNQFNNGGIGVQNHGPIISHPLPQTVTPHSPCSHAHHVQFPGPSPTPGRVHVYPIHPQGGGSPVIGVISPNNIKPIQHAPSNQVIQITPNVSPNGNVATHPLVKTYGIPVNPSVGRIGLLISPGVQN